MNLISTLAKNILIPTLLISFYANAGGQPENFQRTIGGSNDENFKAMQQTHDGGYIIGGKTKSAGGNDDDLYLLRLDSAGNEVWSESYDVGA